jgi:hypothetical protein
VDALLRLLLTNAAAAGLLAVLAFAVSRVVRRPALAHGLWLVALLKLVTPPVVPLPPAPRVANLADAQRARGTDGRAGSSRSPCPSPRAP